MFRATGFRVIYMFQVLILNLDPLETSNGINPNLNGFPPPPRNLLPPSKTINPNF